ncbi:MAG: DUF3883 domain-containing protein [Chloroherpetonaceae bacterium]
MEDKGLEDLIRKRKDWLKSSEDNNFNFNSILEELYADPSHFIYELLQNAEDEHANEIRFELFEDRLDVYHNGKDFDINDIDGVTGIGISKKKDDLNAIGKFGVGFKSVFAVTDTPFIHSGQYKIRITDFVIPESVDGFETNIGNKTLIRMPFNHKQHSKDEIFNLVKKRLEDLDKKTLLFLNNIKEINWETPYSNGHYSKSDHAVQGIPNVRRVTLTSNSVDEYLVFRRPIKIEEKELYVEVAFKLQKDQDGKEKIVKEENTKLVVFFSTEKDTYLNFIIQGPYRTTPNRENIPFDDIDDKKNTMIIEETGILVADSLTIIKDLGYLDANFLSILPINSESAQRLQIYSVLFKKVSQKLLSEKLLPTSDGTFTNASNALLARGKDLTEILNNDDIQSLFSKQNWLDTNITIDRTRELRDYLIYQLKVPEVTFVDFTKKITGEFLSTKSDDWMIAFYRSLLGRSTLSTYKWGDKDILISKPIIRLENNDHIAPFDNNDKIQVYLPAEIKSEYKTVKKSLTENEDALKFLTELGLKEPDLFSEIKELLIPIYTNSTISVPHETYLKHFEKFLTGYEKSGSKREFVKELQPATFICAVNNDDAQQSYLWKANQTYFETDDLKKYFDGYQTVHFVSKELYDKFGEERVKTFLRDLGVNDSPRRIEIENNLTPDEKWQLRNNSGYTSQKYIKDYEYEGLNHFIKEMTSDKSFFLWNFLLKSAANVQDPQSFFYGEYGWFYYHDRSEKFDSKFLKTLKQEAWLVDKNNNFKKPSEITFSDLSDEYIKKSPNVNVLKEALKFMPDIIDQLPENDQKILKMAKESDISPEVLQEMIDEHNKKLLKEKAEVAKPFEPEYKPDEIPPQIIQVVKPRAIVTPDRTGQTDKAATEDIASVSKTEVIENPSIDKKAIGNWGEKYVYNALRNEYQNKGDIIETDTGCKIINADGEVFEIIWLNKNQDQGIGYDFVIKKDEIEMDYIEVKSKIVEKPELIEISGAQWEFARQLFEKNEGEKYAFYIVSNAGKSNASIHKLSNPIKLWKDGELYAHPIQFRL